MDARVWTGWQELHALSDPLEEALTGLLKVVKEESAATKEAGHVIQLRQGRTLALVLAVAALVLVALIAALLAGIVTGLTGFGLALISTPLLLFVYDPPTVVVLTGNDDDAVALDALKRGAQLETRRAPARAGRGTPCGWPW